MKGHWKLLARRIAIPLAAVGLAASLTWVLWPYIRPTVSPLFFVAVVASSMYGGLSAGLPCRIRPLEPQRRGFPSAAA